MPIRTPEVVVWLLAPVTARARPKSATLTRPSSESRTFSGLTSRCTGRPGGRRRARRAPARAPRAPARGLRWPSAPDQVAQRAAADELHREEDVALVGALVVDGDDVGVGQPGRRVRLADEPGDELLVVGQARVHHLERDRAVETVVVGLVDRGHPAPRQPGADAVAPVEQLPDERVADSRVHARESTGDRPGPASDARRPPQWKRALRASTLSTYRRVSGYIPRSRTERRPW